MFAPLVLCAGGFVLLVQSGDRTWSVGVLGTALLFALLFLAVLYVVHLRQALRKLRALRDAVATFVAEDGSFTMTSDVGSSTFVWSTVHDVWKFKQYWLLLFSRAQFVTLPLADIPADMQAYVLERVRASKTPGRQDAA
jgi:hypothetical protein